MDKRSSHSAVRQTSRGNDLVQLVARTRRRLRIYALISGVAFAQFVSVGVLICMASLDMLSPQSVPIRCVMWGLCWTTLLLTLLVGVARPILRPVRLVEVADRIERTLEGMHNRLITVLDICKRNGSPDRNSPFVDRLLTQTRQRLADYRIEHVATAKSVRRSITGVIVVLIIGFLLLFVFHDRMQTAVARVLRPTAPIAPMSWVRIQADSGDTRVLQGEPVTLRATVWRGQAEQLTLHLRAVDHAIGHDDSRGVKSGHAGSSDDGSPTQRWVHYPMQRQQDGQFTFTISQIDSSFEYRILGGGTWTPTQTITMIQRPIIERIAAHVKLPDYLGLPKPLSVNEHARQVSALVGSSVQIDATVLGHVRRGTIQLLETVTKQTTHAVERESVWFDDDLPGDAMVSGRWRWIDDPVYSGMKAHSFAWGRQPYGFSTSLNKLAVDPDASLFLYVWIDPDATPDLLVLTYTDGTNQWHVVWHAMPAHDGLTKASNEPVHHLDATHNMPLADRLRRLSLIDAEAEPQPHITDAGKLPEPGQWQRLEATMAQVVGAKPPAEIHVSGMSFFIDQGHVFFDRAGAILRQSRIVASTRLEPTKTIEMTRDETTNVWSGKIPITSDCSYALRFENDPGHANALMKPFPIVATEDEGPTLIVERPGRSITIDQPVPLPLVVRAFDDFGVEAVALQLGPEPDAFGEPNWFRQYPDVKSTRLVMTAIEPRDHDLEPGASLYYRLLGRDRKGQITHSEIFRLGLASPDHATDNVERRPVILKGLLDGISELIGFQAKLVAIPAELLQGVGLSASTVPDTGTMPILQLVNPEGTPLTDEQLESLLANRLDNLTDEQHQLLAQFEKMLAEQRQRLGTLTGQFEAAQIQADASVFSTPFDVEAFRQMSRQMQSLTEQMQALAGQDRSLSDRLAGLMKLSPQQFQQLKRQLQQLQAAEGMLTRNPAIAQKQLDVLMTELHAQRATQQVRQLMWHMETQRQQLQVLAQQVDSLRRRTQTTRDGTALNQLSQQQQQIDPEVLKALRYTQELIRQRLAAMRNDDIPLPLAPWRPPGWTREMMPVERDTAEEDSTEPLDPNQRALGKLADLQKTFNEMEDLDWWDRPVRVPGRTFTAWANERFANRNRPVDRVDPQSAILSPRDWLIWHQQDQYDQLTQNSQDLAARRGQLNQMVDQMQGMVQQMLHGQSPQALQQLQAWLDSEQMTQTMWMAQVSAGQETQAWSLQGNQAMLWPQQFESNAQADLRPGRIFYMDFGDSTLGAQDRAALYRLPPRIRDPLVRGMTERGPEGYQRLIDAYYRQLSQELE